MALVKVATASSNCPFSKKAEPCFTRSSAESAPQSRSQAAMGKKATIKSNTTLPSEQQRRGKPLVIVISLGNITEPVLGATEFRQSPVLSNILALLAQASCSCQPIYTVGRQYARE